MKMMVSSPSYKVIDLGPIGARGNISSLNDKCQVIGWLYDGIRRAFLWEVTSGFTELNLPMGNTYAHGINNKGQIICGYENHSMPSEGEICICHNDDILTIPTVERNYAEAWAINNCGEAVGFQMDTSNQVLCAFLWDIKSGLINLDTPQGKNSQAKDINDEGYIVGWSEDVDGVQVATLWAGGESTFLNRSLKNSQATAINNSKVIIGTVGMDSFYYHHDDCHLLPKTSVMRAVIANDVNDNNQVIGRILFEGSKSFHAFIYIDHVLSDLNTLILNHDEWVLSEANSINNNGQIVGVGIKNNYKHGFILNPM